MSKKLEFYNRRALTPMNSFERLEWEIPLLEKLASKHKLLHDDWSNSNLSERKYFNKVTPKNPNGWSRKPWTEHFKIALRDVAGEYKFNHRSSLPLDGGEFLWDYIWYRDNPWIPYMVCEIELGGHNAAIDDFKKLLATDAPNAIMIFDSEAKVATSADFSGNIKQMIELIPPDSTRRFVLIYASSTGAVDRQEPRIHARTISNAEVFDYVIDKQLNLKIL